ncbi:hypothetical protein AS27_15113, partial [Aptenodytes forsteri]
EDGGVLPVRVDEEAGEGAVRLDAGVEADVVPHAHLHPHLVLGLQADQGPPRERGGLGPVPVVLEEGGDGLAVLHDVKLEAGAVDGGVDGKVVEAWHLAGELARGGVIVALLVDEHHVKADGLVGQWRAAR